MVQKICANKKLFKTFLRKEIYTFSNFVSIRTIILETLDNNLVRIYVN